MKVRLSKNISSFVEKIKSKDLKDKDILSEMLFLYVLNNGKYSSYYYSSGTKTESEIGSLIKDKEFVSVVGKDFLRENLECLPENIIECVISENQSIFIDTLKQLLK